MLSRLGLSQNSFKSCPENVKGLLLLQEKLSEACQNLVFIVGLSLPGVGSQNFAGKLSDHETRILLVITAMSGGEKEQPEPEPEPSQFSDAENSDDDWEPPATAGRGVPAVRGVRAAGRRAQGARGVRGERGTGARPKVRQARGVDAGPPSTDLKDGEQFLMWKKTKPKLDAPEVKDSGAGQPPTPTPTPEPPKLEELAEQLKDVQVPSPAKKEPGKGRSQKTRGKADLKTLAGKSRFPLEPAKPTKEEKLARWKKAKEAGNVFMRQDIERQKEEARQQAATTSRRRPPQRTARTVQRRTGGRYVAERREEYDDDEDEDERTTLWRKAMEVSWQDQLDGESALRQEKEAIYAKAEKQAEANIAKYEEEMKQKYRREELKVQQMDQLDRGVILDEQREAIWKAAYEKAKAEAEEAARVREAQLDAQRQVRRRWQQPPRTDEEMRQFAAELQEARMKLREEAFEQGLQDKIRDLAEAPSKKKVHRRWSDPDTKEQMDVLVDAAVQYVREYGQQLRPRRQDNDTGQKPGPSRPRDYEGEDEGGVVWHEGGRAAWKAAQMSREPFPSPEESEEEADKQEAKTPQGRGKQRGAKSPPIRGIKQEVQSAPPGKGKKKLLRKNTYDVITGTKRKRAKWFDEAGTKGAVEDGTASGRKGPRKLFLPKVQEEEERSFDEAFKPLDYEDEVEEEEEGGVVVHDPGAFAALRQAQMERQPFLPPEESEEEKKGGGRRAQTGKQEAHSAPPGRGKKKLIRRDTFGVITAKRKRPKWFEASPGKGRRKLFQPKAQEEEQAPFDEEDEGGGIVIHDPAAFAAFRQAQMGNQPFLPPDESEEEEEEGGGVVIHDAGGLAAFRQAQMGNQPFLPPDESEEEEEEGGGVVIHDASGLAAFRQAQMGNQPFLPPDD